VALEGRHRTEEDHGAEGRGRRSRKGRKSKREEPEGKAGRNTGMW
jgi:hypothetical protein